MYKIYDSKQKRYLGNKSDFPKKSYAEEVIKALNKNRGKRYKIRLVK